MGWEMDSYIQAVLEFIRGLDLSPKDFVANGVFFVLDIILISALLPLVFRSFEDRKWKSGRSEIELLCLETSISIIKITDKYCGNCNYYLSELYDNRSDIDNLLENENIYFSKMENGLKSYKSEYQNIVNHFSNRMNILSPAFNSKISIGVSRLIDSWEKLVSSSVLVADLFIVDGKEYEPSSHVESDRDVRFSGFNYYDEFPRIINSLNGHNWNIKKNNYIVVGIMNINNDNIRAMAKKVGMRIPMGKGI